MKKTATKTKQFNWLSNVSKPKQDHMPALTLDKVSTEKEDVRVDLSNRSVPDLKKIRRHLKKFR